MPAVQLRVLFLKEPPLRREGGRLVADRGAEPGWVGICLDRYIVAGGVTREEAESALMAAFRAEIWGALQERREPFADLGPAPEKYQRLWSAGQNAEPMSVEQPEGAVGQSVATLVPVTTEVRVLELAA